MTSIQGSTDTESPFGQLYLESLTPKEKKAYFIAKDHLGMSFDLEKSNGFLEWKKTQHITDSAAACNPNNSTS